MPRALPVVLTVCASLVPAATIVAPAHAAPAIVDFHGCKNLTKKYPHGVGRKGARDTGPHGARKKHPVTNFYVNTALYNANKHSDADKDGIACER
ncbi:excalibur calcium-binding domain-containing protein [Allobranchiibius huperziae]|uniref:Excalibur calcium-binding domain-containing protein n=1 Tax=Allobranchiibius huperziae TaxID=1874116 RepID=A0A853DAB6_9MICO|nr:excalibur calcium-binding domain-containing protein [Allobranchiibius huperziae]NYJ74192.1 hypothetical protein [Allobranchiibius huperziae]